MSKKIRYPAIHNPASGTAEGESITDVRRQEALLKTGALQNAIFNSANFSSIATDAKGVIQIAHPRQRPVQHGDIRAHPGRNARCMGADDTAADDHNFGWTHTGHAAHQHAAAALRLFTGIELAPTEIGFPRVAIRKLMVTRSVPDSFEIELKASGQWRRPES